MKQIFSEAKQKVLCDDEIIRAKNIFPRLITKSNCLNRNELKVSQAAEKHKNETKV